MPLALFLHTQDCVLLHQLSRLCDCDPHNRNSNNTHAHKEKIFTKPSLVSGNFDNNLGLGQTSNPLGWDKRRQKKWDSPYCICCILA